MDTSADPFIAERIPHRPPFLWLDRVVAIDEAAIRAEKTLPEDLDVFRGHYPGYPLLPGVLLCEAVFQAGAVLLSELLRQGPKRTTAARCRCSPASTGRNSKGRFVRATTWRSAPPWSNGWARPGS
jgi:3-hydroxymyristoyl/3-hydroxydecanoyl-(acyl carrier protein) dehydratases